MSITSSAKFYHSIQIILGIWSCDQSLMTLTLLWDFILAKNESKKATIIPKSNEEVERQCGRHSYRLYRPECC